MYSESSEGSLHEELYIYSFVPPKIELDLVHRFRVWILLVFFFWGILCVINVEVHAAQCWDFNTQ